MPNVLFKAFLCSHLPLNPLIAACSDIILLFDREFVGSLVENNE